MLSKISAYLSKLSNFFAESSDKLSKLDSEVKNEIAKEKFKFGLYGMVAGILIGLILRGVL